MENSREFFEVCFGADRAGLYYTTVSTRLGVDEIAYITRDCAAKGSIVSEALSQIASNVSKPSPESNTYGCFEPNWRVLRKLKIC